MTDEVKVRTLRELLSEPLPKTPFVCKPLLPVGGFLLIAGDEKTYKSFLAIDLAYCLASGKEFLNRFAVTKPCSVLYVEMEIGKYRLKQRTQLIDTFKNDPVAGENLYLISKDMRIQLDTKEGFELLRKNMAVARPDVLILDPLVEFHGQEENSAVVMKKLLFPVRQMLQEEFGDASLVLVHHNAKRSEFRPGGNSQSVRGAYLSGAADTIMSLEKPVKNNDTLVKVSFTLRSDEAPFPILLEFKKETGGFASKGNDK